MVGYYYSGNVSDCYNTGAVSGSTTLGGKLGLIINGPISGCFNTGSISGIGASGGVAGGCGSSCTITDCYNTGSIVCIFNCGGIAGLAGNPISNCYNIGTVEGKLYFGGLVGTDNSGAVTNSYYLDTCVVNPTETDGTALTDSAMKLEESYVGFDFENTWSINPLASYPYPTLSDLTPVTPETPVAGVSLNKSVLDLFAGDSEVLIATIEPADATNTAVFWSSSDDSVATVNQSGLVTGIAEGTAIITVTTEDGSFTASCEVNVERREAPEEPEEDDSCWARFLSCLRRIFNFIKSLFNIYH
ncbi:MAG: Ig domain-containing protein [Clostridiales bacterium]|nr:Ig domain-containing protein [Clostridiales bacterium]